MSGGHATFLAPHMTERARQCCQAADFCYECNCRLSFSLSDSSTADVASCSDKSKSPLSPLQCVERTPLPEKKDLIREGRKAGDRSVRRANLQPGGLGGKLTSWVRLYLLSNSMKPLPPGRMWNANSGICYTRGGPVSSPLICCPSSITRRSCSDLPFLGFLFPLSGAEVRVVTCSRHLFH
jgi:hypothetical protein